MELGRVGRHLRHQSPGDHVVDGAGFDVGQFDDLVDLKAGHHGIVEDQVNLDRAIFGPVDATGAPDGTPFMFGNVVPGSGTGELTGLRGTVRMEHERYTLDYELG